MRTDIRASKDAEDISQGISHQPEPLRAGAWPNCADAPARFSLNFSGSSSGEPLVPATRERRSAATWRNACRPDWLFTGLHGHRAD